MKNTDKGLCNCFLQENFIFREIDLPKQYELMTIIIPSVTKKAGKIKNNVQYYV